MKIFNENILNYNETSNNLIKLKESKIPFTVLYAHINKLNNKIYIGQTNQLLENRWGSNGIGYNRCPKFYNAIKKYGWDNFEHVIIHVEIGIDALDNLEIEYIEKYNTLKDGYNSTYGGKKILKHTEEQKEKISKSCKVSIRKKYEEDSVFREKLLDNLSKIKNRSHYGKDNSFYGKTHSNEMKKKFLTREVKCIDTGEIFQSINDACKKYNIRRTGITACCSGKQNRCGGYRWEYVNRIHESC